LRKQKTEISGYGQSEIRGKAAVDGSRDLDAPQLPALLVPA